MKRRNFLKSVLGVAVAPSICAAKLSRSTKLKGVDINFDNIKINGTFDEWVESIRAEADRLLKPVKKGDEEYIVKAEFSSWGYKMPARSIVVSDGYRNLGWFSIAEFEFERNKRNKKRLRQLIRVRFIDMLWSINAKIVEDYRLLKRFDPKYRIELHA